MALSLKDPETDLLAREVARHTGETLTEAVRTSLAERLERVRIRRGQTPGIAARLSAIADQMAELPVLDARTPDEIIGYGPSGAFE